MQHPSETAFVYPPAPSVLKLAPVTGQAARCDIIIESDPELLLQCQAMLQAAGFAVRTNQPASASPSRSPVGIADLIVLDLQHLDQRDRNRLARLRAQHADVPIIGLMNPPRADTPTSDEGGLAGGAGEPHQRILQAVNLGLQGLLCKPVSRNTLLTTVEQVIERQYAQYAQARLSTLARLRTLHTQLLADMDTPALCQRLVQMIREELLACYAVLYLRDERSGTFRYVTQDGTLRDVGTPDEHASDEMPIAAHLLETLSHSLVDRVFQQPNPLRVDQEHCPEADGTLCRLMHCECVQTLLIAPLMADGKEVGVVAVGKTRNLPAFTPHDERLLLLLAQQAATSIVNVRHHEDKVRSEERYNMMLHQLADAVFLVNARTNQICYSNRAAEALTGYSYDELHSLEIGTLLPHAMAEEASETVSNGRTARQRRVAARWLRERDFESLVQQKNGDLLHVSLSMSRVPLADFAVSEDLVLIIARDISRRWRTTRRLVQQEKLQTVSRLLTALAHELNNPLQALQNTIHILLNRELDEARQRRYLLLAQAELDRMSMVVQNMMDIHRPDCESVRPTHMYRMFKKALPYVEQQMTAQSITLREEFAPNLPVIMAFPTLLRDATRHLLQNAVEAMPNGGTLTVRTYATAMPDEMRAETSPLMQHRLRHENSATPANQLPAATPRRHETGQPWNEDTWIALEVSDTGEGISDEDLSRVFDPFYSRRSNGNDGRGLGLTICHSMIEKHGGMLTVESSVGQGTTFRVHLPMVPLVVAKSQ